MSTKLLPSILFGILHKLALKKPHAQVAVGASLTLLKGVVFGKRGSNETILETSLTNGPVGDVGCLVPQLPLNGILLPAVFDGDSLVHKLDKLIQTSRLDRRREEVVFDTSAAETTSALFTIAVKGLFERAAKLGIVDMINVASSANDEFRNRGIIEPVLRERSQSSCAFGSWLGTTRMSACGFWRSHTRRFLRWSRRGRFLLTRTSDWTR